MPKKFLTVKEVSSLLDITPLTVRNWDARGKLVAYRHPINNYRLYKVEDIESLMKTIEESKGMTLKRIPEEPVVPKVKKLKIDIL